MASRELKAIISIAGTIDPSLGRAIAQATKQTGALGTALRVGGGILSVGAAAIGAATTAVVAFGKSSVTTGMEFDKAMSQVAATMGTTSDEISGLTEYAMQMGSQTVFTATQAAEALNYMALAGYDAETSMKMLPNVLNLASAGSMELAHASDMLTDTQTAFGLSIERTTLLVDEMAKAASTGNTSVEQLGDAFLTVGGLVQELNGGMVDLGDGADQWVDGTQQMEIALTAMANAGIKGTEAGTHMRNMLLKLASPTSEGTKQMERLGVSVFDAEGNMRSLDKIFQDLSGTLGDLTQEQKIKAISDLFNARDIASAEALLNAINQDWDKIGASVLDARISLEDAQGAIEKSSVDLSKYTGDARINVKDLAADIRQDLTTSGMSAQQAARDIAETYNISFLDATKAVNSVIDALHETQGAAEAMAKEKTNNLAGDVAQFNSALEYSQLILNGRLTPSLREFVQFGTNGLQQITKAFREDGISGAMGEMGNVLAEGINKLADVAPQAAEAGAKLLEAVVTGLAYNAPVIATAGAQIMQTLIQTMIQLAPTLIQSMATTLSTLLSTLISPELGGIFDRIIELAGTAFDTLMPTLETAFNSLMSLIDPTIEAISPIIDVVLDIVGIVIDAVGQITQALNPLIEYLTGQFSQVIQQIAPMVAQTAQQIVPIVSELITGLLPPLIDLLSALSPILEAIFAIIGPLMGVQLTILSATLTAISEALPVIIDLITQITEALSTGLGSALEIVMPVITAWVTSMLTVLQNIIDFVVNVFTGQWDAAWQNVMNIFTAIFQALAAIVQGALDAVIAIAVACITNLADSIISGLEGIVIFVQTTITNVQTFLQTLLDFVTNIFTGQWGAAWESVKTMFSNVFNALAGIAKGAFNAVISVINTAIDAINQIHIHIPAFMGFGGLDYGLNIGHIPMLASGGFTNGPSIAGEAGQEAVISFDPSVRQKNLSYWAQAGKLLGVNSQAVDTVAAGAKASGASAGNSITFSPNVTIQGNADYDTVMQALRDNEEEFMDMLNEFLQRKESVSYG